MGAGLSAQPGAPLSGHGSLALRGCAPPAWHTRPCWLRSGLLVLSLPVANAHGVWSTPPFWLRSGLLVHSMTLAKSIPLGMLEWAPAAVAGAPLCYLGALARYGCRSPDQLEGAGQGGLL